MQGKRQFQYLFQQIEELFFPVKCRICQAIDCSKSQDICENCFSNIPFTRTPICSICGRDYVAVQGILEMKDHVCEKCLRIKPPFSIARGITYYEDPVKSMIHDLKYRFDTSVIASLGRIAQSYDFSAFESCDIIIPVPLHPRRLKRRGMNQALVFARMFFAGSRQKICTNVIKRVRNTQSQTKLNAIDRRKNLEAAFSLQDSDIVKNRAVCLVDDIFTTGITVTECAKIIQRGGASDVRVLTMARVREFK